MTDKAKRSFSPGKLLTVLGIVLLAAAAVLFLGNRAEETAARQSAERLLAAAVPRIRENGVPLPRHAPKAGEEPPAPLEAYYDVDGILTVPDLGLTLPVLADYSDELLKISVCIFEREGGTEDGRMILAGHDYKSHFGRIAELQPGAPVGYETLDGEMKHYTVTEVTSIEPDDRDGLEAGDWDITLYTCSRDLSRRILVRLAREA